MTAMINFKRLTALVTLAAVTATSAMIPSMSVAALGEGSATVELLRWDWESAETTPEYSTDYTNFAGVSFTAGKEGGFMWGYEAGKPSRTTELYEIAKAESDPAVLGTTYAQSTTKDWCYAGFDFGDVEIAAEGDYVIEFDFKGITSYGYDALALSQYVPMNYDGNTTALSNSSHTHMSSLVSASNTAIKNRHVSGQTIASVDSTAAWYHYKMVLADRAFTIDITDMNGDAVGSQVSGVFSVTDSFKGLSFHGGSTMNIDNFVISQVFPAPTVESVAYVSEDGEAYKYANPFTTNLEITFDQTMDTSVDNVASVNGNSTGAWLDDYTYSLDITNAFEDGEEYTVTFTEDVLSEMGAGVPVTEAVTFTALDAEYIFLADFEDYFPTPGVKAAAASYEANEFPLWTYSGSQGSFYQAAKKLHIYKVLEDDNDGHYGQVISGNGNYDTQGFTFDGFSIPAPVAGGGLYKITMKFQLVSEGGYGGMELTDNPVKSSYTSSDKIDEGTHRSEFTLFNSSMYHEANTPMGGSLEVTTSDWANFEMILDRSAANSYSTKVWVDGKSGQRTATGTCNLTEPLVGISFRANMNVKLDDIVIMKYYPPADIARVDPIGVGGNVENTFLPSTNVLDVVFNQPIKPETIDDTKISVIPVGDAAPITATGSLDESGTVWSISFPEMLEAGATYQIKVDPTVETTKNMVFGDVAPYEFTVATTNILLDEDFEEGHPDKFIFGEANGAGTTDVIGGTFNVAKTTVPPLGIGFKFNSGLSMMPGDVADYTISFDFMYNDTSLTTYGNKIRLSDTSVDKPGTGKYDNFPLTLLAWDDEKFRIDSANSGKVFTSMTPSLDVWYTAVIKFNRATAEYTVTLLERDVPENTETLVGKFSSDSHGGFNPDANYDAIKFQLYNHLSIDNLKVTKTASEPKLSMDRMAFLYLDEEGTELNRWTDFNNVSLATNAIELNFGEVMNLKSMAAEGVVTLKVNGEDVPFTMTPAGPKVILNLEESLIPGATYAVSVLDDACTNNGDHIKNDVGYTFTVGQAVYDITSAGINKSFTQLSSGKMKVHAVNTTNEDREVAYVIAYFDKWGRLQHATETALTVVAQSDATYDVQIDIDMDWKKASKWIKILSLEDYDEITPVDSVFSYENNKEPSAPPIG